MTPFASASSAPAASPTCTPSNTCNNPKAEIVALCDRVAGPRARHARRPGACRIAFITDDMHALLKRPDIDLVEILLPHHLQCPAALAAIAAGKAVSLQKPMCLNVAEADEVVAAAKAAQVPFRVFENFIFYPPVMKAKELVDERRHRRPALDPHQEQPGQEQDRLGDVRRRPRPGGRSRQEPAAGRWSSTTAITSSRSPGISWAWPKSVHAWIGETTAAGRLRLRRAGDGLVPLSPATAMAISRSSIRLT